MNARLEYMKESALFNKRFLEDEISKENDKLKIEYLKGMLTETKNELALIDVIGKVSYLKAEHSFEGFRLINNYVEKKES